MTDKFVAKQILRILIGTAVAVGLMMFWLWLKLIAESLAQNPLVLQSIALDKWDGKLPYVNGGGALPFINVNATNR